MTINQSINFLLEQLEPIYGRNESFAIIDLLLENLTGMDRLDRSMNSDIILPVPKQRIDEIVSDLKKHMPVQYILGESWFYGNKFIVNKSVLIPRPETEELIAWIISDIRSNNKLIKSIIDIGTGTGCIPITLKKHLNESQVSAIDVCSEALHTAINNAVTHETEINFQLLDFLDESKWNELGTYDIIVSNPPYIKTSEAKNMSEHVLQYEPHKALFVPDDDALLFYRKIADFSLQHLNKNGAVYVEINQQLGNETSGLFQQKGFTVELRKDMSGNERMLKAVVDN